MKQSELKTLRSMLLRVKHKTGCTIDECIDFVDKKIKPESPITHCKNCEHFIYRIVTPKGCLKGICELSPSDNYGWKYCQNQRRRADERKCKRFKEESAEE